MAGAVHTEAYKALLRKLVALRNEKEWSQADLADLLGKPPSFVGKYELGERRLDVIEAEVICRCLDSTLPEVIIEMGKIIPEKLN